MSVGWYIILEKEIPGLDPFVSGKALARAAVELDSIATELGVQPLMEFFSASPEELAGFAESEGIELADKAISLPPERWYSAQEGLRTVGALIEAVASRSLNHADKIMDDLKEFTRVLEMAQKHGVGWHLAVDF